MVLECEKRDSHKGPVAVSWVTIWSETLWIIPESLFFRTPLLRCNKSLIVSAFNTLYKKVADFRIRVFSLLLLNNAAHCIEP